MGAEVRRAVVNVMQVQSGPVGEVREDFLLLVVDAELWKGDDEMGSSRWGTTHLSYDGLVPRI